MSELKYVDKDKLLKSLAVQFLALSTLLVDKGIITDSEYEECFKVAGIEFNKMVSDIEKNAENSIKKEYPGVIELFKKMEIL